MSNNRRLKGWTGYAFFFLILALSSSMVYLFYLNRNPWKNEIWMVMDTFFEFQVPSNQYHKELKEEISTIIYDIEALFNSYHKESEISRINQSEQTQIVTVSEELWQLLNQSKEWWQQSKGLFNPCFQPLQDLYGFNSGSLYLPTQKELEAVLEHIDFEKIVFFEESRSILFQQKDTFLNFSALIKGLLLDNISEYLESKSIHEYLLNFGGSIKINHSKPQTVYIQHPRKRSFAGSMKVTKGSISTSSDSNQYFERNKTRYSHIVNPVTGSAQNPIQSATVIHPESAVLADALSTILILMKREEAESWMQTFYPEVAYVLIDEEGISFKNIPWKLP